jgi:hypothetical protein
MSQNPSPLYIPAGQELTLSRLTSGSMRFQGGGGVVLYTWGQFGGNNAAINFQVLSPRANQDQTVPWLTLAEASSPSVVALPYLGPVFIRWCLTGGDATTLLRAAVDFG